MNLLTSARRRKVPFGLALTAAAAGAALSAAPAGVAQGGDTGRTITVPAEMVIEVRTAQSGSFTNCSSLVFARWPVQPNAVPGSSATAIYTFNGREFRETGSRETSADKPHPFDDRVETGSDRDNRPRIFEVPLGFHQIMVGMGSGSGPTRTTDNCEGIRQRQSETFTVSEVEVQVGPRGAVPQCRGQNATIVGTNGRNVLNGTRGRDVIVGLGGNDVIRGRGGNDLICAGSGNDLVLAGAGNDEVLGQAGRDRIRGQAGNDLLRGGSGNDNVDGQAGADRAYGDAGRDILRGSAGPDRLYGGTSRDRLFGNGGNDLLVGNSGRDLGVGGPGRDRFRSIEIRLP